MENLLKYKLTPQPLESQYRSERDANDRKQLLRIFWMTAALIAIFIFIDSQNLSHIPGYYWGIYARLIGLLATLVGILKIRRSYVSSRDENFVFGCGLIVVGHLLVNNFVQTEDFVSIASWDIAAIFAIYSLVPIGLFHQMTLALFLSLGSQIQWIIIAVPQLDVVGAYATPIAYLAANGFGVTLSLTLNRIHREEFKHLIYEKDLRRDLEQSLQKLKTTMNTRDQLFSMVAHDLRGPIGSLSQIGMLLNSTNPIELRKRERLIELLCIGSKTSYDLLDNLLNWALSETGSLEPVIQSVDLQKAIDANIELLTVSAKNKNLRLYAENSKLISIKADPKMLDTVLRNIISNAIKFTNDGGEIKISQSFDKKNSVTISIQDNGIGIDPKRIDRLFDLDFKETSFGTNGENGSNLGLRICKDFTARQGGTIAIESESGKGSCFRLTFPLA